MIDLLIFAIGYESRSMHALATLESRNSIGLVFAEGRSHSFESNFEGANARGAQLIDTSEVSTQLPGALTSLLASNSDAELTTVGVDVSSMSRSLMSAVIKSLAVFSDETAFTLRILYSEGEYLEPSTDDPAAFDLKPIVGFEGWSKYPERPLSLIVGLGYEEDQAVAAIEYFDPSIIRAFIAHGSDERFLVDVLKANDTLRRVVDESSFLEYQPESPFALFAELLTLTDMLSKRSRVVIVTGGPKIFSALSMLVQHKLGNEVSLWQISSHQYNEPRDVEASGPISVFDYKFVPHDGEADF